MNSSVSIVTVAYNSSHIVNGALSPFSGKYEIICVDNASSDDLDAALADLDVRIIKNLENIGFGRACNQGLAAASSEFVLFINPDVRVDERTIPALLAAARMYADSGVFLPLTIREDGSLWVRNVPAGSGSRGRIREDVNRIAGDFCSQFLDGSIFLFRRSLFEEIGGFDENIFLYYEDDDLSRRLMEKKSAIIVVSDAYAKHAAGRSVSGGLIAEVHRNKYKKISEIYYLRKHNLKYIVALDAANHVMKIVFYTIVLDFFRLSGAFGRFMGIASSVFRRSRRPAGGESFG